MRECDPKIVSGDRRPVWQRKIQTAETGQRWQYVQEIRGVHIPHIIYLEMLKLSWILAERR